MMTTVLLRTIVRICGADTAIVAGDVEPVVFGTSAASALELVDAVRDRQPLPGARVLVCELAIPLERPDRAARLYVFARAAASVEPALAETLRVIAAEIGAQLDLQRGSERAGISPDFDELMGIVAGGIDSINDPAAIFEWQRIGSAPRILYVNLAFESLFGFAAQAAVGQTTAFLHGPLTDPGRLEFMNDRVRETGEARSPVVYYRRDGLPVWIELSLRAVRAPSDTAWCTVATLRDVTTRKEFESAIAKEKRKLQVTLAAIGDAVITTVADGRIDFVNLAAQTIFGVDAAETYGEPIATALYLSDAQGATIDVLSAGDDHAGTRRGQALFGRGNLQKHVAFVTSPIADEGYVVVLRDVTAAHRLATRLSYEASHDPLTGMYNRRKFEDLLSDAIEGALSGVSTHALAFLDLDHFKAINDSCGHAVGDRVLLDLAHLLQQQLRGRDVLARIGGDEFAVLLHECSLENARRVLDDLRRSVESYRLSYRGVEYRLGVSIGIAPIDGDEADGALILRRADAACYAAKQRGRNAVAG